MPVYAGIFLFSVFASAGLPGLSGFVGEFTILIGSYLTMPVLAIIAGFGVILAAVYLLWAYERVFTGPVNPKVAALKDMNFREIVIMIPLVVLILGLGIYPKPVMERIQPSVEIIMDRIEAVTGRDTPEFGREADLPVIVPGESHDDADHGDADQGEGEG
jgi:NADH-quinone oxidoreductase subunit M